MPRVSVRNSVRNPISAAGRHEVLEPHPAGAVVDHLLHAALAQGEQLRQHADVLLGRVDREPLDRLVHLAVDLARHDLRLADRELEALAAHELDEHRQLQLAAALHLPGVRPLGREHAERDVADQLGVEPALDLARRQPRALEPGERRGVDADRHRERRLVDLLDRQRPRIVDVGERLADRHLGDAGDGDDVARPGLGGLDAVERLGHVELGHLGALDRAVGAAPGDLLALADRAVAHPADREPADVRRRVEVRDERLQRVPFLVDRRRDRLERAGRAAAAGRRRARRPRARPARPWRCSRRSGTRSGSRRRRGRGTARRPR